MKNSGFIAGAAIVLMGIAGCNNQSDTNEQGTNQKVTPDDTRILNDSSQAETFGKNEQLDQKLNGFMGIQWQQTEGDLGASIKTAIQNNGSTISAEKNNANSKEYTIVGGNFKDIPIQRGVIVGEQGKGLQDAILTLKPASADINAEFQNLVTAMSAEYGKTHEMNENGVVWYFKGTESSVIEASKNNSTKTLRIHARRGEGGTPYSWDKTASE